MRNFITIFIYIILLPTFEYFRHSLQYIDILTIQIRHTTNEGRKPIPNISALIARITASTLHILFVILCFKCTFPNYNLLCFITGFKPFLLELHIIYRCRLFRIHYLYTVNTFLLYNNNLCHNP